MTTHTWAEVAAAEAAAHTAIAADDFDAAVAAHDEAVAIMTWLWAHQVPAPAEHSNIEVRLEILRVRLDLWARERKVESDADATETYFRRLTTDWDYLPGSDSEVMSAWRDRLSRETAVQAVGVHVGAMSHMAGLAHMAAAGTMAGRHLPYIAMRDGTHGLRGIHTHRELVPVLAAAAAVENRVEAAHNIVVARIHAELGRARDKGVPLAERQAAATEADRIARAYVPEVEAAAAAYDPSTMPEDLPTLRLKLRERLEADAMGATQAAMKAASQQGVDRGWSCVDEERAVRAIGRACVLGAASIMRADDDLWARSGGAWSLLADDADPPAAVEHEGDDPPEASLGADGEHYRQLTGRAEAQAAYDAAVAAIEAVEVVNVPVWTIDGAEPAGAVTDVAGEALVLRAMHPAGATVDGDVVIDAWGTTYAPGTTTPPTIRARLVRPAAAQHAHELRLTVESGATYPIEVRANAFNLCGPAHISARLTGPSTTA